MNKKEDKSTTCRRRGLSRRTYSYARHIPERRSGEERRKMEENSQLNESTNESQCDSDGRLLDEEIADQIGLNHNPIIKNAP